MKCKVMLMLGAFLLMGESVVSRADEPWLDWNVRMQIRFAEEISSPLTNFPLLVVLDETIEDFAYADFSYPADGADLRFANEDEDALLDYEIEDWNTNGASYVWVKVPLIESTNDFIYAYWGRSDVSHAPSTTNGAVWSEDFAGVWHLTDTNVLDSTSNENHPTSVTALTATNGMINGAMAFNGLASGDSRVVIPNDSSLNPAHLTFSAWVKPLGPGTHADGAHIFSKGRGGNPWASYTLRYRDDQNRLYATITTGTTQYTLTESDSVNLGQFYHIAATYDGSTFRLYRDGIERASMAASGNVNYSIADNNLHIGGWNYSSFHRRFNGVTDNLQISSVPRSADWLYATWLSQASNHVFLAFELAPMEDNLGVSARAPAEIGNTSALLRGRVLGTGEAENPEVYFAWGTSDGETNALTDWFASIPMGTDWGTGEDFETPLTGLTGGQTYYYRTYVTNSTGEAWSQDVRSFTTLILPWSDWTHRMQIRFAEEIASPLTNFPLLVVLDETIDGFAYDDFEYPADGADLRFANAAEDALLDYEIEEWNPDGASYVWVKVPLIESTNDFIHAYWGRSGVSHAPSTSDGSVWSEDFAAVWHMNESGGTTNLDSTANNQHGTWSSGITPGESAVIAGGNDFGGSDHVFLGSIGLTQPVTLEMWLKPDVVNDRRVFSPISAGVGGAVGIESGSLRIWSGSAWNTVISGVGDWTDGWRKVALVFDSGGNVTGYLDGAPQSTASSGFGYATATAAIGGRYQNQHGNYYSGLMDEVRLSSVARSADWLYATWLNQASNHLFLAFEDAGVISDDLAVSARPASGISDTSATLRGRVLATGGAENPEVYFAWGTGYGGTNALTDWFAYIPMGTDWGSGEDFETPLIGLTAGETYYYRTYVTNSTGEAWSQDVRSFTTLLLPAIDNLGADWVRRHEASVQGEVTSDGGEPPDVQVELWADASSSTSSVPLGVQSVGPVSTVVEGLEADTLYHFRFAASNNAGVVFSAPDSFTTWSDDPVTWYVAPDGPDGVGTNWATAMVSLHDAMDRVLDGDTVLLTNAVHMLTESIAITNGITISGPWGREQTTIKRDTSLALFRLFSMTHSDAVIEGVTLTQGRSGVLNGGGIHMTDGLVRDVIVDDCRTDNQRSGGGISIEGGRLESSIITNCWANQGGGIRLAGSGIVSNVVVTGNSAVHGGGGLFIGGANALLTHSVIEKNQNSHNNGGGGIWIHTSGGTVQNSLIHGNSQTFLNNTGGGVRQTGGSLVNCTVVELPAPDSVTGGGSKMLPPH